MPIPSLASSSYDFVFTPDGERIVCIYQLNAASPKKLISVKTTGFPVVRADLFVPNTDHNVGVYRISPDSQWVVFSDYPSSASIAFCAPFPLRVDPRWCLAWAPIS